MTTDDLIDGIIKREGGFVNRPTKPQAEAGMRQGQRDTGRLARAGIPPPERRVWRPVFVGSAHFD